MPQPKLSDYVQPGTARLIVRDHPFNPSEKVIAELAPGVELLAPQLERHVPTRYRDHANWVLHVNGRRLSADESEVYTPGDRDLIVAQLVPGPPVILFVIAYAASLAASAAAAIGAAASAVGGLISAGIGILSSGGLVGQIFQSAITFGISALASKLFAPDLPKAAKVGSSSPFYSVQAARNQQLPQGSIQQSYGLVRVVPDLVGNIQTTIDSTGNQSIRALYCVGQGRYDLSEFRYGSQPLSFLNPTKMAIYNGENVDPIGTVLKDFLMASTEEQLNFELRVTSTGYSSSPKIAGSAAVIRQTAENALGFDVAVVFPQGLYAVAPDSGNVYPVRLSLEVSYRATGTMDPFVFVETEEQRRFFFNKPLQQKMTKQVRFDFPTPGQYDIKIQTKLGGNPNNLPNDRGGKASDSQFGIFIADAVVVTLRSYLPGTPIDLDFAGENLTMFGIEAKASDLIQGQLDLITCKAFRRLPTFNTGTQQWTTSYSTTKSPAWAAANEYRDAGCPDDEIDGNEFKRFADFCVAENWECNITQTEEQTLDDAVRTIMSAGQGGPTMKGSLFSVTFDEEKDPVGAFGPLNMAELEIDFPPVDMVHATKVRYPEEADDGKLNEIIVYEDGYNSGNAEIFETLDLLIGLTTEESVIRHVELLHLKRRYRNAIYRWLAPIEANYSEVGDVVILAYGGALMGPDFGQTRITSYSTRDAGAHVDEIFVHPNVRMEVGKDYVLKVRTRVIGDSGTGFKVITIPIVNPLTAGVQKFGALEVDGDFDVPTYEDDEEVEQEDSLEGAFAFLGEPEGSEVIILGVEPVDNYAVRLTGGEYARAQIFGA